MPLEFKVLDQRKSRVRKTNKVTKIVKTAALAPIKPSEVKLQKGTKVGGKKMRNVKGDYGPN